MRHSLAVSFCLPFCQRMLPASAQLSNRYNLGLLTRKSHLVVDVSFPRVCSEIIGRAVRSLFPLQNCKQSATLTRLVAVIQSGQGLHRLSLDLPPVVLD